MLRSTLFIVSLFLFSCNNEDQQADTKIPTCIQDILDDATLSEDIKTIRVHEKDNELSYWINTDFTFFDGTEYIINAQCDTLCFFCGDCFPSECAKELTEDWTVIWED